MVHRLSFQTLLALRMLAASVTLSVLLFAFVFARYALDVQTLRKEAIEAEVRTIIDTLRKGGDPALRDHYVHYPSSYAFRIFDRRSPKTRRLIAEVNSALFTLGGSPRTEADISEAFNLSEGGGQVGGAASAEGADRWIWTDHEDIGSRSYWVQVVMAGDPAGLWLRVIWAEMVDRVVIPVILIVPALTFAMLITARLALRPLDRVARDAERVTAQVRTGFPLTPLSTARLPVEFEGLIGAINLMIAALDRSLQLQKQFTADAAHELRTPLSVLALRISTLPSSPEAASLREEVLGLSSMIAQLLQLAQAEEAMSAARHPTDVTALARKVCEDLAGTALARRQTIEFSGTEHATVIGHAALIETAIRNVVENALCYSPREGLVSVTVDTAGGIRVDDNGPGVPDVQKSLVFGRFWRADRRSSKGNGIGLALVRRVTQLHGGDVRIEDRQGGGASFTLTFRP